MIQDFREYSYQEYSLDLKKLMIDQLMENDVYLRLLNVIRNDKTDKANNLRKNVIK